MKLSVPEYYSSVVPIERQNYTKSTAPMEMHRARLQNPEVCVP